VTEDSHAPFLPSDGSAQSEDDPNLAYGSRTASWVLLATILGSSMASLDATVVGIALPVIGKDFHATVAGLQWVVTAYTLSLAGLLLLGGSLGDRLGRRRVFLVGVAGFAAMSMLCALAPSIEFLIAARVLQGVAAALLTPGSLAILEASFRTQDRSRAIGAWTAFGGIAGALGPFIGGWLIAAVSWRLIFLLNVPLAAVVLIVALRHVPESLDPTASASTDYKGAISITVGLAVLTYGLISAPSSGWRSAATLALLIGGVACLVVFVVIEARERMPMLPVEMFRSSQFLAANAVTLIVYAALSGAFFLLPVVLEELVGYTPLFAGASVLPVTAIMFAFSARSGALAARIGPRLQMSVGPLVTGAGLLLFGRISANGSYLTQVLPAVVVFGVGLTITVAPLTATALAAAPAKHAGMASAVNNDVARIGGLVAVALLPVLAGITGKVYLHPLALAHGFRVAMVMAALACAAGGVLAGFGIRNDSSGRKRPHGRVAVAPRVVPGYGVSTHAGAVDPDPRHAGGAG
jgi:EmrB/QacA subfamily drug resistance transporter